MTERNQSAMIRVRDGFLLCPQCSRKLLRLSQETEARRLPIFCRGCRTEIIVNIDRGLSARRLSP